MKTIYEVYSDQVGGIEYVEIEKNHQGNHFEVYGEISSMILEDAMAEMIVNILKVSQKIRGTVEQALNNF